MNELFGLNLAEKIRYAMLAPAHRSRYRHCCFTLYPFAQLHELIHNVSTTDADLDEEPLYKIRFVMSTQFQVWFSKEGSPSAHIPGHGQMLEKGSCLSAGVLRFNKEFDILEIDHKSGDYRPHFHSLQWFLLALALNLDSIKIKLPTKLSLLKLDSNGGSQNKYELSVENILNWVQTLKNYPKETLLQQAVEKKQIQSTSSNSPKIFPSYLIRNLAAATLSRSSMPSTLSMHHNKNTQNLDQDKNKDHDEDNFSKISFK